MPTEISLLVQSRYYANNLFSDTANSMPSIDYLVGLTLKYCITGKALDIDTVLSLGIEIADELETAHSRGIVHRDIKPANTFVTECGPSCRSGGFVRCY